MQGLLPALPVKPAKKLRWTGKTTDLVELLYALDTCNCINNGEIGVEELAEALSNYHARNAQHPGLDGFRVRIYRDLGKNARAESEAVMTRVLEQFGGLRAYRTFDSPYYKVSVGDCRTRFEAYVLRQRLLSSYPRSFVVTERINFPATD